MWSVKIQLFCLRAVLGVKNVEPAHQIFGWLLTPGCEVVLLVESRLC